MESIIFNQIEFSRKRTLDVVSPVSEQHADIVPKGFNNSIRWNLGHILTIQERLAFELIREQPDLDANLMGFFMKDTKPSDWQSAPPDLPTLFELLKEQPRRLQQRLQGRLAEPLVTPFRGVTRLDELLILTIGHEGLHTGYIMAQKRAVAAQVQ
ncbi:hypothetical protein SD71_15715 [Cohnella kolymensis]|uniref:DinB-like domain-containing protein n=1 Tax=Cohnella kolymensis TaxID=1590652 RepID=A0ABR5A3H4_9BACL|nr:DinB family protein [Cohnella kolymensis]KIL35095.1 hypothetical protein SD71_15715 [Cohnella kolymensis]